MKLEEEEETVDGSVEEGRKSKHDKIMKRRKDRETHPIQYFT